MPPPNAEVARSAPLVQGSQLEFVLRQLATVHFYAKAEGVACGDAAFDLAKFTSEDAMKAGETRTKRTNSK